MGIPTYVANEFTLKQIEELGGVGERWREQRPLNIGQSMHSYFIRRETDVLRPKLLLVSTSTYAQLDNSNSQQRNYD
jgi:hypothetical protein